MIPAPVTSARFAEQLSTPPQVAAAWNAFSLQRIDNPLHMPPTVFADHVLFVHISGTHRLRLVFDGRVEEGRSEPGAVHLVPAGAEVAADSTAPSRGVLLFLPDAFVSRTIGEHWDADPQKVEIVRQFLIRDRVVETVMTALEREARSGSLSGQLYAESACEFLAHHVIRAYSTLSAPPPRVGGGLAGRRLSGVLDYIQDALAQPISLRQLASVAGISARHFERAFRQAMGVPPHAYVMERRVAAARDLLINEPSLSVEDIAARVGFSSPSHLASAFRRRVGYSPTRFRQLQSR